MKLVDSSRPAYPARWHGLWPNLGWRWCLPILVLALLVRLYWFFAPFTNDPKTIVAIMRAMVRGGFTGVLASVKDRIYLPFHLYLLLLPGWFSHSPALGAPTTPVEMLALRLALIAADVLLVAAVFRIGRQAAGLKIGLAAALWFALWPGGIYVDSWWAQTDIWYVGPLILACWWLSRQRVELAWLALALGASVKWQAAFLLPVFIVGTWRWFGWRGLLKGGLIGLSLWGLLAAPIVLSGSADAFLTKTLIQDPTPHVVEKAHNFWFALAPAVRALTDQSRDTNPWVGGISFHDAALVLVALFQMLLLARLVWRSRPRDMPAAGALAILSVTMFATQVSTRHYMAVPALLLLAACLDRKWWLPNLLLTVTQIVNLVWENGDLSPVYPLVQITAERAAWNAWANLAILGLALAMFGWPVAASPIETEAGWHRLRPGLEPVLLALGLLATVAGSAALLWRGQVLGRPVLNLSRPLYGSLEHILSGDPRSPGNETVTIINWPLTIAARRQRLWGVLPMTPPELFVALPYAPDSAINYVQYPDWQSGGNFSVAFTGAIEGAQDFAAQLQQADRAVIYHPATSQMVLLEERLPAPAADTCRAEYRGGVCLADVRVTQEGTELRLDLFWLATEQIAPGLTVLAEVNASDGHLLTRDEGEPVGDMVPLASLPPQRLMLHESRWIPTPAGSHELSLSIYDHAINARVPVACSAAVVCAPTALLLPLVSSAAAPGVP